MLYKVLCCLHFLNIYANYMFSMCLRIHYVQSVITQRNFLEEAFPIYFFYKIVFVTPLSGVLVFPNGRQAVYAYVCFLFRLMRKHVCFNLSLRGSVLYSLINDPTQLSGRGIPYTCYI